jgi:hypothetical protein
MVQAQFGPPDWLGLGGLPDFLDPLTLEETEFGRRFLFETRIPQNLFGKQRQQLSAQFAPTFNRFLGQIGQQIQGGSQPQSFQGFLEQQFDPQRQLLRMPSPSAGRTTPLVTPTLFNFPR